MVYKVYTTPSSFPEAVNLNGLFTSVGVNVTTTVPSALVVGDYLYSTTNNELRRVMTMPTPKTLTIESAFTVDVTNQQIKIPDKTIIYTDVSIANFGTVDGFLNGAIFPKRTIENIEDDVIIFTINGTGTFISVLAV